MRRTGGLEWAVALGFGGATLSIGLLACATTSTSGETDPGNTGLQPSPPVDGGGPPPVTPHDAGGGRDAATPNDGGSAADTGTSTSDTCTVGDGGADAGCYAITCTTSVQTLQANRDRLIADYARRRCSDSCTLWSVLNQAERYIFLMDTAYLGAPASRLYPPGASNLETALDHAVALYTINGPMAGQGVDLSGRGGNDYNRIYLGFDSLAECLMRDFQVVNPTKDPSGNLWVTSDDLAGPHAPFTQREMIFWYKAFYDLQSEGPQWHHWHQDSDYTLSGIDTRLGVCGNTDRSLTELTIAFDSFHNSDPLGDYSGRGGYGWQIVSQYVGIDPEWDYMPTGCPVTQPVNTDEFGGGTFNGMGPSADGGACWEPPLGDGGC
jgi:hypothetical protein